MEASIKKTGTETAEAPSQEDSGNNRILDKVVTAIKREVSSGRLDLKEFELKEFEKHTYEVELKEGPSEGELFLDVPQNPLDLKLSICKNGKQAGVTCTIKASGKVGAAWLGTADNGIPVIVKPKVDVKHLLYMILWAYFKDIDKEEQERTHYDREFLYIMPRFFLDEVEGLVKQRLNKVLRRTYTERHEELKSRIKGRPELQLYIKRNLPKLKNQDMPCCWWELNKDNDYNRALKLGLHLCKRSMDFLQRHYSEEVKEDIKPIQEIKHKISSLLKLFEGVTLDPQVAYRVNRLRPVGNFRPYRKSIEILKYLLKHLDFNLHGDKFLLNGIVLEMHDIFENCVVNYLAANCQGLEVKKAPSQEIKIKTTGSEGLESKTFMQKKDIVPDASISKNLENDVDLMILDTKWKEALEQEEPQKDNEEEFSDPIPGLKNLKIKNADLYQMVAYGMHWNVKAKSAILVYPLDSSGPSPGPYEVVGFMGTEREYPIYITGIPMQGDLSTSLKNFTEKVQEIFENKFSQD